MSINTKHNIGWRNIKTSLAVMVCLLIGRAMENNFPLYACTAAIICMKDTIKHSVKHGMIRMKATIIGGVIAIVFLAIKEYAPFDIPNEVIVPLGIMITIYFCGFLDWKEASGLACVVVLVILLMHNQNGDKYIYAINRVIETLMGIVVAVVINTYIVPPEENEEDEKEETDIIQKEETDIIQKEVTDIIQKKVTDTIQKEAIKSGQEEVK